MTGIVMVFDVLSRGLLGRVEILRQDFVVLKTSTIIVVLAIASISLRVMMDLLWRTLFPITVNTTSIMEKGIGMGILKIKVGTVVKKDHLQIKR
jgi:hypothetical protein